MSVVRLDGVWHRYATDWVLRHLDLSVERDDAVAIVGPSGSGKSTLLGVLGLLITPIRGSVAFEAPEMRRSGDRVQRRAGSVAWVFQGINTLPRRTVIDNAALGALAAGATGASAISQARTALEAVGLKGFEDRRAASLSGGELQRLTIARAVLGAPRLILADEPTGQLDQETSRAVASVLVTARPTGTALVVATHDTELATLCPRRFALVHGYLEPL